MRENRKTMIGRVISDKMDKTVVVNVESSLRNRLYRRIVRTSRRFKAHDEQNTCRIGDLVEIQESRPISKEKHWRVAQIIQRGEVAELQPRDIGAAEEAK